MGKNNQCSVAYHKWQPKEYPWTLGVDYSHSKNGKIYDIPEDTLSDLRCNDEPGTGVCKLRMGPERWLWSNEGRYNVMKTDYKRYAVVYGCSEFSLFWRSWKWEWAMIYTRDMKPTDETMKTAENQLNWTVPSYPCESILRKVGHGDEYKCMYKKY